MIESSDGALSASSALPANGGIRELLANANREHASAQAAADDAIAHAMAAGDLLIAAKRLCRHGDWTTWLSNNCDFSPRTAQVYIRLAKGRQTIEQKRTGRAHLGIEEARKLIAGPPRLKHVGRLLGLDISDVYAAFGKVGDSEAVVQLEQSQKHRGYWYYDSWTVGAEFTITSMRPIQLALLLSDDGSRALFDVPTGDWMALTREDPILPLIDERVRIRAYGLHALEMRVSTFAEAIEVAEQELKQEAPTDVQIPAGAL